MLLNEDNKFPIENDLGKYNDFERLIIDFSFVGNVILSILKELFLEYESLLITSV